MGHRGPWSGTVFICVLPGCRAGFTLVSTWGSGRRFRFSAGSALCHSRACSVGAIRYRERVNVDVPLPGPPVDPVVGIDSALAGLEGLEHLEIVDHVARFDIAHTALTVALSSIDKV